MPYFAEFVNPFFAEFAQSEKISPIVPERIDDVCFVKYAFCVLKDLRGVHLSVEGYLRI